MEEVYKTIDDYDNYEISNMGNVRNIKTDRVLKPSIDRFGYKTVGFYKNRIRVNCKVHRLVGLSFIPNPEKKKCIDHCDRNKLNNTVQNLRWVSHSENNTNITIRKDNTSTHTGVIYHKRLKKWLVNICINGLKKHIGYFTNFDDAVKARKEQETIYYKEFQAFQNDIDRLEFEFQQAIK